MDEVKKMLHERKESYGTFMENARFIQFVMRELERTPNWKSMTTVHKEAIHMILHKLARLCCGSEWHEDSAKDIVGYSRLLYNWIESGGKRTWEKEDG